MCIKLYTRTSTSKKGESKTSLEGGDFFRKSTRGGWQKNRNEGGTLRSVINRDMGPEVTDSPEDGSPWLVPARINARRREGRGFAGCKAREVDEKGEGTLTRWMPHKGSGTPARRGFVHNGKFGKSNKRRKERDMGL